MKHWMRLTWIIVLALILVACRSQSAKPGIRVEKAWGRPSPKMAMAGAFYMTIYNDSDQADRLLSASSPACKMIELHESYMMENGSMGMRPVQGGYIEIPARGSVELKVGGLHIMCMEKQAEFKEGDKYPLTLKFEKAGDITVEVEIHQQ